MTKLPFVALLIFTLVFFSGAIFLWRVYFSKNIAGEFAATVKIGERTYRVEVAQTLTQKAKGLAGRDLLEAGTGMLFPFGSASKLAFTMHGMRFPLDIIWIADGKIVDIAQNLQPDEGVMMSSYRPSVPADTVLELNAGVAEKDGLKVGDLVQISAAL